MMVPVLKVLSRIYRKCVVINDSDSLRKISDVWNGLGYCTMYVLTIIAMQGTILPRLILFNSVKVTEKVNLCR